MWAPDPIMMAKKETRSIGFVFVEIWTVTDGHSVKTALFAHFVQISIFFVSWETVHVLCGLEFAFARKHTASFWRSFKL